MIKIYLTVFLTLIPSLVFGKDFYLRCNIDKTFTVIMKNGEYDLKDPRQDRGTRTKKVFEYKVNPTKSTFYELGFGRDYYVLTGLPQIKISDKWFKFHLYYYIDDRPNTKLDYRVEIDRLDGKYFSSLTKTYNIGQTKEEYSKVYNGFCKKIKKLF